MKPLLPRLERLWIRTQLMLGIPVRLNEPDRVVLESSLLPYYASLPDIHRVLFVGTAWYSAHYPRLMPRQEFWTIDPVAERRRYGAQRHLVDVVENITRHVAPSYFDLVVMNGVIGFGLDKPDAIERSIAAVFQVLRPGGRYLLGWDDVPKHRPLHPEQIQSLRPFVADKTAPGGQAQIRLEVETQKVYELLMKPEPPEWKQ